MLLEYITDNSAQSLKATKKKEKNKKKKVKPN